MSGILPAFPLDIDTGPGIAASRTRGGRLRLDVAQTVFPTSGSANVFIVNAGGRIAALIDGLELIVRPNRSNTGSAQIQVKGFGSQPWLAGDGAEFDEGAIRTDRYYRVFYDLDVGVWRTDAVAASIANIRATAEQARAGTDNTVALTPATGNDLLKALLGATMLTAPTFAPDEPSASELLADIYGRMITPEQGGVDLTGAVDSGAKLSKLMAKAIARGKTEFSIGRGQYLLKTPISANPTAGLVVRCHPQAVFVADYALTTGPVRLSNPAVNAATSTPGVMRWEGGIFDVRRLRNVGPSFPCDSLSFGENVQDCSVVGAVFIHSGGPDVEPMAQGLGKPVVTAGGSGYTTATVNVPAPDFRLPDGSVPAGSRQATAVATITNGIITALRFTNNGRGYTSAPALTVTGDGSGATISCSPVSDYRTAGGDSSISFVGSRMSVRGCTFIGAVDCGVYPTARADGSYGDSLIVDGNFFLSCNNAVVSKRGFQKLIHVNNFVHRCNTGFSGGIADVTRPSARELITANNIFDRVVGSVAAFRQTNGGIFANNLIKEFGFDLDDNRASGFCLRLEGASYTQVTGNTFRFEDLVSGGNHMAVRLASFTQNGVRLDSTNNLILGNVVKGFVYAFLEADANQDRNKYLLNTVDGVVVPYTLLGPNSIIDRHTAEEKYITTQVLKWRGLGTAGGFTGSERQEQQAALRTTAAGVLNALTIPVPVGTMCRITVEFSANNDDGTASYGTRHTAVFRRPATGPLVQVGVTEGGAVQNDFVGTPTVALFADADFNAIRARVQGLAGLPINWRLDATYRLVTTNA